MRPSVLLPVALLFCSCTKTSETAEKKADSPVAIDSASSAQALAATKKSTAGEKGTGASSQKAAPSGDSASSQAAPASAKTKAGGPADTRCGITGNPVLTDMGVGTLAVGRTITSIKERCRVIRDIEELTSVGTVDRVLTVVAGGDVYRVTAAGDLVARVSVRTPRAATPDGLRVGTPLSRVAAEKGVKIAEGEDGVYLLPESHCGLSFRFSIQSRWPTGRFWTVEELRSRYGRQPVDRILVTRCLRPG
jgi:hypothetical protein